MLIILFLPLLEAFEESKSNKISQLERTAIEPILNGAGIESALSQKSPSKKMQKAVKSIQSGRSF